MPIFKSALFVDFDNIYLSLKGQDQRLADSFAEHPDRWLQWLENNVLVRDRGMERREVLVRKCYLNPSSFSRFRPYFIKAAFSVVDCPTLTSQGKNSSDIHMVLDILETLDKENPTYDEFIIFSGDSDFRPVLIKLRENARLTTVLTVGGANLAYKAAATVLLGEERFIDEALGADVNADLELDLGAAEDEAEAADEDIRKDIAELVLRMVRSASTPTVIATIGDAIRKRYPDRRSDDWFGAGRLKDFLSSLDLDGLEMSFAIPGYVYDPEKHALPEAEAASNPFLEAHPDIFDLAKQVHQLTDTPLLSPETYAVLFRELASSINENGHGFTETSRRVRDRCVASGAAISRQQANFVIYGLYRCKYRFDKEAHSAKELAEAFAQNVYNMCLSAQMEMNEARRKLFFAWLLPKAA
ncbi:NYN domain-containing protein [Pseudodesulfovibrio sp.]|uniref:NYN domain-containing protein n=1 Tax=Pseudodesulfovibrio sp. TaxID=2035812 RepID=UPI0026129829|nr:NYN domain-containing protein [Pseudodesulfovibrio sp.]MDD3311067.1 NYN domain-containing protein [Pseudodesulfovibrio sp.]